MIITYFGDQFFKIAQGDTVVAVNPVSKDSGKTPSKFGSILALSTTKHPLYNGFDTVTYGDQEPFMVAGPGEYECHGITILGKGTTTEIEKKEYNTTVYSFTVEDIKIGFIGPIDKPLTSTYMDVLQGVQILFVPLSTLSPADAAKLSVSVSPNIIIPMEYTKDSLKLFLKEIGDAEVEEVEKLTIRKKEVQEKDGDVIILKEN